MKSRKINDVIVLLMMLLVGSVISGISGCGKGNDQKTCDDGMILIDGTCHDDVAIPCDGDDSKCEQGFFCGTDNKCEARVPCSSNDECRGGICSDKGACLNVGECSADISCIPGDICNLSTRRCEPSPCSESCQRGICNFTSKQCEDSLFCNEATESTLCLEGSKCLGGTCVSGDKFCESETCPDGGVCDTKAFACVNAVNCQGDDSACLPNFYCNQTSCEINVCAEDGISCLSGGGVCNKSTGLCENPETCSQSEDCLANHSCVIPSDGELPVCIPKGQECQDKCEGNQVCHYLSNKTAQCEENAEGCTTSLDCLDLRVCRSNQCVLSSNSCSVDAFEPNDDLAQIIDFHDVSVDGRLNNLTLCENDVDLFEYDLSASSRTSGVVIFQLAINEEDVGAGEVVLKISDENQLSQQFSNLKDGVYSGFILGTISFTNATKGKLKVEVSSKNLYPSGVRYALEVSESSMETLNACEKVRVGVPGIDNQGSLQHGVLGIGESCNDPDGHIPKEVWKFTITDDSRVSMSLTPAVGETFTPVVSVRTSCYDSSKELPSACHQSVNPGGTVLMSALLARGDYYIVVSSKDALTDDLGKYTLKLEANPIACQPDEATCIDGNSKSRRCNDDLTDYVELDCGNSGCDAATGYCVFELGNTCGAAIPITESNSPDYKLDVSLLTPNIWPDRTCPNMPLPASGAGREGVFKVNIPHGRAVEMTIRETKRPLTGNLELSAYILTDCLSPKTSCIIGSDGAAAEKVKVGNHSGKAQDYYFVADLYGYIGTSGEITASFVYSDYVCSKDEFKCNANHDKLLKCNDEETDFVEFATCPTGCNPQKNRCNPAHGNTCADPIVLESGNPKGVFEFGNVEDKTPSPGACGTITGKEVGGNEFIFKVTTTEANQIIDLLVTATSTSDPMVWLADGCVNGQVGACLAGENRSKSSGENEFLRYVAPQAGDYYFVVENAALIQQNSGKFSIRADVRTQDCNPTAPPSCNGGGDKIVYCSKDGLNLNYECDCSPGSSSCSILDGKSCFSAHKVDTLNHTSGEIKRSVTANDRNISTIYPETDTGECRFLNEDNFNGSDVFYEFDLIAGQFLEVDVLFNKTDMNRWAHIAYFVEKCEDLNTCKGSILNGNQKLSYRSPNGGPVYLVIDSKATSYDVTLQWSVSSVQLCSPGQTQCTPGKNDHVSICARDGASWNEYLCPGNQECSRGACEDVVTPYVNATCNQALPIPGKGAFIAWDPTLSSNDSKAACVDTAGNDIYYKVSANAGDVIEVEIFSINNFRPSVYILDDCTDQNRNYCLGSKKVPYEKERTAKLRYIAPSSKDYIIVLDGVVSYSQKPSYARIEVVDAMCDSTYQPQCSGNTVMYCENGEVKTYSCPSGTCSNGTCSVKTGDSCFDALPIDLGNANQGVVSNQKWDNKTRFNNLNFSASTGISGSCIFTDEPEHEDLYYAVSLNKGDLFTASLSPTSSLLAQLYVIAGDCDAFTCIVGDPLYSRFSPIERLRKVSFVAEKTQTYYIVVSKTDTYATATNSFDLNWEVIRKPTSGEHVSCEPFTSYCDTDTSPNAIRICNESGTAFLKGECPGLCKNAQCQIDRNLYHELDSCGTMVNTIEKSGVYTIDFNSMSDHNTPRSSCSGHSYELKASDAFFKVRLEAKGRLDLYAKTSSSFDNAKAFIFKDCSQIDSTCLATGSSFRESINSNARALKHGFNKVLSYKAGAVSETFYVAIDATSDTSNYARQFFLDILIPECDPSSYIPSCNGNEATYCTQDGLLAKIDCAANGGTCSYGVCTSGDGRTCHSATYVVPEPAPGKTVTGSFKDASNAYELERGNQCTSEPTSGRDRVYAVYLQRGQTLEVTAKSTETPAEDIAIYLTPNCHTLPTSCVAGSDSIGGPLVGEETLTYQATSDGLVYLVIDSFYPNNVGEYSVTLKF